MNFNYFLNPKNYLKLFYKPHRVFSVVKMYWNSYQAERQERYDAAHDVKLKKIPDREIISVLRKSLEGLERLAAYSSQSTFPIESISEAFGPGLDQNEECEKLAQLFVQYGSDKATTHDYHQVYYSLLKDKRMESINVFEIGLGTNNIDVLSNMGRNGKPGASLRAFRDFLPQARVYGADIDTRVLFTEDRIETFFIDQVKVDVLNEVKSHLQHEKFDLIIDDGLHNSEANLNTIAFALDLLSDRGVLAVEDINSRD